MSQHIINTLIRTYVIEFYRMNSGFFLVCATLAFGFMSEIEHKALAQFFVSSFSALAFPLALWLLYGLQIIQFNARLLRRNENHFLYNLAFLPMWVKWCATALFLILQFLPAIGYGCFLIAMAAALGLVTSVGVILTALISYVIVGTFVIVRDINNPYREVTVSFIKKEIDRFYIRPSLQYYTEWLLRREPLMVFGIKVINAALLFGVCMLYHRDDYDIRLMCMAIAATGVVNMIIVFHLIDFEHRQIPWVKNLPMRTSRRFVQIVIVILILLIPEFAVLIKHYPEPATNADLILMMLYMLSWVVFFIGFIHTTASPLEHFVRKSFWFFILSTILILFKVPLIFLTVMNVVAGYALFRKYYYLFEPRPS